MYIITHKEKGMGDMLLYNYVNQCDKTYDTVGSFSLMIVKISLGLQPGLLAKRWLYSPRR